MLTAQPESCRSDKTPVAASNATKVPLSLITSVRSGKGSPHGEHPAIITNAQTNCLITKELPIFGALLPSARALHNGRLAG